MNDKFNYYKEILTEYLEESFPELAKDEEFIHQRVSQASDLYEAELSLNGPPSGADEVAIQYLFNELHFSKWDCLRDIISEKFSDIIPSVDVDIIADQIFFYNPYLFPDYITNDNFLYTSEFDELCKDITEFIQKNLTKNKYNLYYFKENSISFYEMFPGKYFSKYNTIKTILEKVYQTYPQEIERMSEELLQHHCDYSFPYDIYYDPNRINPVIETQEEFIKSNEYKSLCEELKRFIKENVIELESGFLKFKE